jgi:hypothetical protein
MLNYSAGGEMQCRGYSLVLFSSLVDGPMREHCLVVQSFCKDKEAAVLPSR